MISTVAALLMLASATTAAAEPGVPSSGWWMGLDLGAGRVSLPAETVSSKFSFNIEGGYAPTDSLLLGLHFGGYSLGYGNINDPREGEGISRVMAISQWYFTTGHTVFLRAGAGAIDYWSNRPDAENHSGWGWAAGIGINLYDGKWGRIGPTVLWDAGHAGVYGHHGIQFLVRWSAL